MGHVFSENLYGLCVYMGFFECGFFDEGGRGRGWGGYG